MFPTSADCSRVVRCLNFIVNDEIPIDFRLPDFKLLLDCFRKSLKAFCCFSFQQLCANEDDKDSRPWDRGAVVAPEFPISFLTAAAEYLVEMIMMPSHGLISNTAKLYLVPG